jgi:hypothetical protein
MKSNETEETKAKEVKEVKEEMPKEWVCIKRCYASPDGNPLRMKGWEVGERFWGMKSPSRHFITKADFDAGADGRAKYLNDITRFGGRVTEEHKSMPIDVLKAFSQALEREYLRRQASK